MSEAAVEPVGTEKMGRERVGGAERERQARVNVYYRTNAH